MKSGCWCSSTMRRPPGARSRTTARRTACAAERRESVQRDAWLDQLLSREGQQLLDELSREQLRADAELALLTRYRARYSADLVSLALAQVKLRDRARAKFTNADRMYFTA